ncbi:SH3 and multiple ankyrin repeat domains protein 2 [Arthrobotrys conoides]|uniref:SH3 and multiple ankyrin repeat domains protein 2 n=1 Tax=Arthrobotrys conoides TaxID=74498 RepID=A0AAN8NF39_9PEZI
MDTRYTAKRRLTRDDYTIGIVYARSVEMHAILTMLDEEHESLQLPKADENEYILGRIGPHNIIVVGPPRGEQGKVAISTVVTQIRFSFWNVRIGLLVGVGDGVPRDGHDVRLGDVVVSAPEKGPAVVQYDLGVWSTDGFIEVTRALGSPPPQLLSLVNKVEDRYQRLMEGEESFFTRHLKRFEHFPDLKDTYRRPNLPDLLFPPDFLHEAGKDCILHHEDYQLIRYPQERWRDIEIHHSTILSGDSTMSCGRRRDELSAQHHNALCFETEAAGLMDIFPCLVIRGICGYADSHRNEEWQGYAAATAAAYAREILCNMAERVSGELELSSAERQNAIERRELEERIEFLRLLYFTGNNHPEISMESAYINTYEWIEDTTKYRDRKSPGGEKLLITGKETKGSQH